MKRQPSERRRGRAPDWTWLLRWLFAPAPPAGATDPLVERIYLAPF